MRLSIAVLICSLLAAGCSAPTGDAPGSSPADGSAPIRVRAVNYPLSYFAERIGGDGVNAVFDVPAEVDPAFWRPAAEAIAEFQNADLILLNGAGYARWIAGATLPSSRMVDTSASFAERLLPREEAVTHRHGPEGEHSHSATAYTTWLDLSLAHAQARAVADALGGVRADDAPKFESGFEELRRDIESLDRRLVEAGRALGGTPLLASHPVYPYLARRYGLDLRSVHFEPDEAPSAEGWRELEERIAERPARWMLWESEPLPETRRRLEELGVESVVYDPCAGRPAEGDWLTIMRENVERLEGIAAVNG